MKLAPPSMLKRRGPQLLNGLYLVCVLSLSTAGSNVASRNGFRYSCGSSSESLASTAAYRLEAVNWTWLASAGGQGAKGTLACTNLVKPGIVVAQRNGCVPDDALYSATIVLLGLGGAYREYLFLSISAATPGNVLTLDRAIAVRYSSKTDFKRESK